MSAVEAGFGARWSGSGPLCTASLRRAKGIQMDNASEYDPMGPFDELFNIQELEPRLAASPDARGSGAVGSGHVLHGSGGTGSGHFHPPHIHVGSGGGSGT